MGLNYQSHFICQFNHSALQFLLLPFAYHVHLQYFHEVSIRNDAIKCSKFLSSKTTIDNYSTLQLTQFV